MVAPLLDDIKSALVTAGLVVDGVTGGWTLYLGHLQETPDRAVCIYETPGVAPEEGVAITYPDFQVRVRGEEDGYEAARAKMQAISTFLHAAVINSDFVYCYEKESGIIPMGQDSNRRPHMTKNFRTMRNAP